MPKGIKNAVTSTSKMIVVGVLFELPENAIPAFEKVAGHLITIPLSEMFVGKNGGVNFRRANGGSSALDINVPSIGADVHVNMSLGVVGSASKASKAAYEPVRQKLMTPAVASKQETPTVDISKLLG